MYNAARLMNHTRLRYTLWFLSSGVLVLSLAALLISEAYAHVYTGYKWNHNNITYRTSGLNSANAAAVSAGVSAWNNSAVDIRFAYSSYPYDFEVQQVNSSQYGWDGLRTVTHCSGNQAYYCYALVQLNEYFLQNYSSDQRHSVAAHELGHVVSLAHEQNAGCVLMLAGTADRWSVWPWGCHIKTPQIDDLNGVNLNY